ncbi:MAG: DUF4294 domain-containing protein, partial [Prevotella sp.]|nr:DUF4294 domain-containing protein [Prevotella sp.]
MKRIALILTAFLLVLSTAAQEVGDPQFVPMVKMGKTLGPDGDTIQYMEMQNVYVYPEPTFKNKRQQQAYIKLVRNVK